jgi:hypothetical protein
MAKPTPLASLPNLGPKSQLMLEAAGIMSFEQLREMGAVAAFSQTRRNGGNISLNLLWALEGALSGLPWQDVARKHRTSLLLALEGHEAEMEKTDPTPQNDWRSALLDHIRQLIQEADPAATEDRKWIKPSNPAGVPTWSHDGILCTGETYKHYLKFTFAKGASLPDPARLFNASLDGNARRAIDIRENDKIDEAAFKALINAAAAFNTAHKKKK